MDTAADCALEEEELALEAGKAAATRVVLVYASAWEGADLVPGVDSAPEGLDLAPWAGDLTRWWWGDLAPS